MAVRTARLLPGLAAVAIGIALLWTAAATAAPPGATVRLGVTGMVTPAQPQGTWRLGAHSGDTLSFLAGSVPGLDHTDLDETLGIQVSMDASDLPGGSHGMSLSAHRPYRVTVKKAGSYPIRWTVAFVLKHGHTSSVEATHDFSATLLVGRAAHGNGPGLANPPPSRAHAASAAAPEARTAAVATTAAAAPTTAPSAAPASAPPPTITLTPDTGQRHPPGPAALPKSAPAGTYLFTALVGTFILGVLWVLWVASIKPILGR